MSRYGMMAGNGRFPLLALETGRRLGDEVGAIGIKEEASPAIAKLAALCHWISLGQLTRLIEILKEEHVTDVRMAGQVKPGSIFSAIQADLRLFKLLAALKGKNTDALIGAITKVLSDEGIRLTDSTLLLKPLLADAGVLTKRKPSDDEEKDIAYGRRIANALAGHDVGQSVAICDRACVAVEAMEGTDAMLRRAASLVNGKPLRLVKVSRRRGHLLFDVPVAGSAAHEVMRETGTTALAVDAGRTLLLDREEMLEAANASGITICGADWQSAADW